MVWMPHIQSMRQCFILELKTQRGQKVLSRFCHRLHFQWPPPPPNNKLCKYAVTLELFTGDKSNYNLDCISWIGEHMKMLMQNGSTGPSWAVYWILRLLVGMAETKVFCSALVVCGMKMPGCFHFRKALDLAIRFQDLFWSFVNLSCAQEETKQTNAFSVGRQQWPVAGGATHTHPIPPGIICQAWHGVPHAVLWVLLSAPPIRDCIISERPVWELVFPRGDAWTLAHFFSTAVCLGGLKV